MSTMHTEFRGECSYQAESDVHFPHLTVSQTLTLAAEARAPRNALVGSNRKAFAVNARDATLGALNLSHVADTFMGNDYIRGVSGGERKRASVAEKWWGVVRSSAGTIVQEDLIAPTHFNSLRL